MTCATQFRVVGIGLCLLLAGACSAGDKGRLQERVRELEQELVRINSEMAAKDAVIQALRERYIDGQDSDRQDLSVVVAQQQQELEEVTNQLVRVKVERDQLKQELNTLMKQSQGEVH